MPQVVSAMKSRIPSTVLKTKRSNQPADLTTIDPAVDTTIREIKENISSGGLTLPELVEHYLHRIGQNSQLNAFIEVFAEKARNSALLVQEKIRQGTAGKLAGLVIGIKD